METITIESEIHMSELLALYGRMKWHDQVQDYHKNGGFHVIEYLIEYGDKDVWALHANKIELFASLSIPHEKDLVVIYLKCWRILSPIL